MSSTNSSSHPDSTGFTITGLRITGPGKRPAQVAFRSGLNVIAGASDTGKTHILECIDFMLGASVGPQRFPENRGYTEIFLSLKDKGGNEITLRRAFDGGALSLYDGSLDVAADSSPTKTLGDRHAANNPDTVSGLLLGLCGLDGKQVRKNQRGVTRSISFRDLAQLTIVSEETMWRRESPILSDNPIDFPVEAAVFDLMLTGTDDAAIVALPDPKIRKAKLEAQLELVRRLIGDRETALANLPGIAKDIGSRLDNVNTAIVEAASSVTALQTEMTLQEGRRQSSWQELRPLEVRLSTIQGLLARFELLARHYESDVERLEAMIEAGKLFSALDTVACPLCGSVSYETGPDKSKTIDLANFEAACRNEIAKINLQTSDLAATRQRLEEELVEQEQRRAELSQEIRDADRILQETLQPRVRITQTDLSTLLNSRSELTQASSMSDEIRELERTQQELEIALKTKHPRSVAGPSKDTLAFDKFAKVVEGVLRSWKYPELDRVTFDTEELDLVVSGRARGSQGKGYRAFAHAAFTFGLMRYCRESHLPHPGLVVLDSPLVTLREADRANLSVETIEQGEEISTEMKDAFYDSLKNIPDGDQVIVLENDEPPMGIRASINYLHFSGAKGIGQYGFYPQ